MRTYELQILDRGSWQTDSIYDDRRLAETQAKQLEGTSRYAGIRVIEEVFHEGADKSVCTTVYRDAGKRQANNDRIKKSQQEIRNRAPASNKEVARVSRKNMPRRAASSSAGLYWGLGISAVIAAAGGSAFMLL